MHKDSSMTGAGGRRKDQDARRQQIVDAAAACARRSGFHGASMAEIAQAAGLSVGQIYRYFENKEAVMAAIVARDTAEIRGRFSELEGETETLREAILDKSVAVLEELYDPQRAALRLEVAAEAARNPAVAAIVQAADAEERQIRSALLERMLPQCEERDRLARSEVLNTLFDGTSLRAVSNPKADKQAIAQAMRSVLRHLLTDPC